MNPHNLGQHIQKPKRPHQTELVKQDSAYLGRNAAAPRSWRRTEKRCSIPSGVFRGAPGHSW